MQEITLNPNAQDYHRVAQLIHFLDEHYRERPDLETLADHVHLSPAHLERLFKRWAGITPMQFLHLLSLEHAKSCLRASRSVLDAALDAGLSGPGRLHDLFVTIEALTPGEYKLLGAGLQIAYGVGESPFGSCLLATTARGICSLQFLEPDTLDEALALLKADWPNATLIRNDVAVAPLVAQIFEPGSRRQPFHLLLKGTNLQVAVWRALLSLPPGTVTSYGALAAMVGHPRAQRAVGAALARNPIGYLIPCHRVINSLGKVHGYRWGLERKRAIFVWESAQKERAEEHSSSAP